MSAKIAVTSSITWLIGWMRPVSTPLSRTGRVTSTASAFSRASSAAAFKTARRCGERLGDFVLEGVDGGAGALALVRRHLAERREQGGYRPLLAERAHAHALQRGFVRRGGDGGEGFGEQRRRGRSWGPVEAGATNPSPASGRRWRAAPDEGLRGGEATPSPCPLPQAGEGVGLRRLGQKALGLLDDRRESRRLGDGEIG